MKTVSSFIFFTKLAQKLRSFRKFTVNEEVSIGNGKTKAQIRAKTTQNNDAGIALASTCGALAATNTAFFAIYRHIRRNERNARFNGWSIRLNQWSTRLNQWSNLAPASAALVAAKRIFVAKCGAFASTGGAFTSMNGVEFSTFSLYNSN